MNNYFAHSYEIPVLYGVSNVTCPVMPVITATFLSGSPLTSEHTLAGSEYWAISDWLEV